MFKDFISERFINAVGNDETALDVKLKYRDQVWDLLQTSYANIGGIKGSGFGSKEEMVVKLPMWKIIAKDGKVHAVVLYKDKGGRKSVAMGSDGSDYAKKNIANFLQTDFKRSFGEKSKGALGSLLKAVPWNVLEPFVLKPKEAEKALGKPTVPVKGIDFKELPADAQITLKKNPELINYAYLRDLNGKPTFKVLIGTTGKTIR